MKKFLHVLTGSPLFVNIASSELEMLLGCLAPVGRSVAKGEVVMAEGEPASHIGIVLSGSVQVVREDYYGNRSMMGKISAGGLFAEAFACAGVSGMPVSVIAAEASEILLIEASRVTHSCAHGCSFHHQLIYNLMKILATKNLICNQKIEVTSKRTTREKLMAYLLLEAKRAGDRAFDIPYDRQELADYLEVDRSGLSAEISKLRREGVLIAAKNHFELLKEK